MKEIIEGVEYEFISILNKRPSGHTVVSVHKNGVYYRTYKHIWVWMLHYRKHVPEGYVLHHINKDETDDRIENLQLVTRGEHNKLHADDVNHYMFRKGHRYWTHPKSEEHKNNIKQAHIRRANKERKRLRDNAIDYIINNRDCSQIDVIKNSGGKQLGHFYRRFGVKFLTFKEKVLNGERKKGD